VCRDHLFAGADLSEASGFYGSLVMLDRFMVDLAPRFAARRLEMTSAVDIDFNDQICPRVAAALR
jgi:hypothetical protein